MTFRFIKSVVIAFVFGLAFAASVFAQSLPIHPELDGTSAFRSGEKLEYIIHYKWLGIRMDVGTAKVELLNGGEKDGRPLYHSKVYGATYRFWDHFFRVRDLFESRFFGDDISPSYFHRNINEGGYKITNHHYWNYEEGVINARVSYPSRKIDTVLVGDRSTFDIVTLFYYSRNIDFDALEKGVNYPVKFTIDEELFDVYFRFIGREEVEVPTKGKFKAMKFAAKVIAGEVFKGDTEMIIWVSDDLNRVPLLFESAIRVGKVYGRLDKWENLKYEFKR